MRWLLFNFDNATGILSNVKTIYFYRAYGIEFSPSGDYLYVGKTGGSPGAVIAQFDVTFVNQTQIQNSVFYISLVNTANFFGMLQLGPGGKIYVDRWGYGYLGVIRQPDLPGSQCNYLDSAIYLEGFRLRGGLPGFNCSYFAGGEHNWESVTETAPVNLNLVSPNPFSSSFTITNPYPSDQFVSMQLHDLAGREVYSLQLRSEHYHIVDVDLPRGVYFCRVYSESGRIFTSKVIRN
ncbi:MAG TPA: T9SS type A sorting domain-containing protein [Bacteroidia bacterium]|nr:T9SS type A sorting domain-containing protein [Bacteroidia bacterium]